MTKKLARMFVAGLLAVANVDSNAMTLDVDRPYVFPQWRSERDDPYIFVISECGNPHQRYGIPVVKNAIQTMTDKYLHVVELRRRLDLGCPEAEGRPQLYAIRLPNAVRELGWRLGTRLVDYNGDLPVGTSRTFDTDVDSTGVFFEESNGSPDGFGIPPSIGGTWYDPEFPAQGLLLTLSREGLVVSWNTYDAHGAPIWLTGLATQTESYTVQAELFSTRGGVFAGAPPTPPLQPAWGRIEIEYLACGRLRVQWQPSDTQAYRSGETEMRQLTSMGAHGGCSIEDLAGSIYELTIVEPILQLD